MDISENLIQKKMEVREILDNREAAAFLRISIATLWRMRRAGKIKFHRINNAKIVFKRADLESYLDDNERAAYLMN